MTFKEAIDDLGRNSSIRPGQTAISRNRVLEIVDNYNPTLARSSAYKDGNIFYLVEGHHTTVAAKMLGKSSGFSMNVATTQLPSAKNIYWTKNWYEFGKRTIKTLD